VAFEWLAKSFHGKEIFTMKAPQNLPTAFFIFFISSKGMKFTSPPPRVLLDRFQSLLLCRALVAISSVKNRKDM
jgi:hypothetical protein